MHLHVKKFNYIDQHENSLKYSATILLVIPMVWFDTPEMFIKLFYSIIIFVYILNVGNG